jgi:phenylacetate-coenzyme A ligase PaaK-like adenylate-forming protein
MPADHETLRDALTAALRPDATLDDEAFGRLALDVFRHQYGCNRPYRAFCDARGATPDGIVHWTDVPAVPTDAFKAAVLVCDAAGPGGAIFETSGTTRGAERRGRHHVPDLRYYDAALRAGFATHLLPDGARPMVLSLVAPYAEAPNSSLSYMADAVLRDFGAPGSRAVLTPGGVDYPALRESVRGAADADVPVCLLSTSFALVHLFERLDEHGDRLRLPTGSRLMDTGGFKGRARELTREELAALVESRLGIERRWYVNEYGMTEMSSQFYDGVAGHAAHDMAGRVHRGPAWVRTRAVDPETMRPLPDGEIGILRHWDLANVNSVMALQTADLGRVEAGGGFRLLGRARGAEARGCSLAVEELIAATAARHGADPDA